MFNQLLPQRIDNTYRGHKLALWLFGLLVLMKVGISLNSIFNGDFVARSADGIPLDSFTPAGAQAVVALFALWGLAQLMICLLCMLVVVRYRAMMAFMFALLLLEHLSRKLILQVRGYCHDWNITRLRREPRTPYFNDRWPSAVATDPR